MAGVMEADIAGLSLNDERKNDTINSMLNHINNMDREMRKNNLRIFGVADIPDESTDETKAKVISDVLNKAFNIDGFESDKGDEHNGIPEEARFDSMACLDYAKRLGKYVGEDRPRPILARFKCADDKFNLFKYRDKLRSNGIRIANDLTFQERQQLEDLKRDGRNGYFSKGKLVVIDNTESGGNGRPKPPRVFRRANRRLDDSRNQPMDAATSINLD